MSCITNAAPGPNRQGRSIGDFRQWKDHDAYAKTLERLLRDLQVTKT